MFELRFFMLVGYRGVVMSGVNVGLSSIVEHDKNNSFVWAGIDGICGAIVGVNLVWNVDCAGDW